MLQPDCFPLPDIVFPKYEVITANEFSKAVLNVKVCWETSAFNIDFALKCRVAVWAIFSPLKNSPKL